MTQHFDNVLRYEAREMGDEEALVMFQEWLDTGEIWQLPTAYLDVVGVLVERGLIKTKLSKELH